MKSPIDIARGLPQNATPDVVDKALRDLAGQDGFKPEIVDDQALQVFSERSGLTSDDVRTKLNTFHTAGSAGTVS